MIRARIHRARPDVWVFALTEDVGDDPAPFIIGKAGSWAEARDATVGELRIFAEACTTEDPEPPPLVSPAARERSWLARLLCPGVAA